jgi:DNA-binding CsgD family transcriptional regulator/tetratricopeptide (TPR) repeat protein
VAVLVASRRFVGRADELSRLEQGLSRALEGRAAAFLVAGEAGVGKSRLLDELVARARARGATALVGGCLDVEEGRLPFGPFIEALRGHVRELDDAARSALAGDELAHIVPELGSSTGQTSEGALVHGRLFELFLGLTGRIAAATPLVLVLEDLHWADRSTRDLLLFLVRNLRSEPVLLVASYRSDDLYRGHPLRPFLAELERTRRVDRLDLEPLDREELAEMVSGIVGARTDIAFVESVFARSEGNPFFAEELVAAGAAAERLPQTLQEILLARVDRVSPAARALLAVVAVGGRDVSDRLLAAVSAESDEVRSSALREVLAHQLLVRDGGGGYVFRHALLREVAYDELLPGERARIHAAYGSVLSAHPDLARDRDAVAGDLARHWFAAHDLPRALVASVQAGGVAEARSGFAEAQLHYERALELWDQVGDAAGRAGLSRIELARRAAEVANLAGEHGRAAALIRQALDQLDRHHDAARTGLLWERLGRFLWAAGDSETALDAYERAVALVPADPPSPARARVLAARGQALMLLARYSESRACCEAAIAIARRVGAVAEQGHALNTLGCDLAYLGDAQSAVSHLYEARRIAEEVGDLDDLFRAYLNLSDLLIGPLNRVEEGLALARDGAERSRHMGMAGDYGVSLQSNAATALIQLGRFEEAALILRDAERRNASEMAAIDLHRCWARLALCRGTFDDALARVHTAGALMVKTVDPPYHAPLRAIEAELALWQRRPLEARGTVAEGLRQLEGTHDPWLMAPLLWLGLWAEADLASTPGGRGRPEAAAPGLDHASLLALGRDLLAGPSFVAPLARTYLSLCEAEAARIAPADARGAWAAAATACASVGHPYLEGYAHWRHAEALLAHRQARPGTAALARAHVLAERIGAGPLRREVELLARRARIDLPADASRDGPGGPPAGPDPARGTGLTPRQLEVLALIAAGLTNREIAQRLFITEKTAGAHVSSILAGLHVRSRVEAATAAHRLGLVGSDDAPATIPPSRSDAAPGNVPSSPSPRPG